MTSYPSIAHAVAAQNCRIAYMQWFIAEELHDASEPALWKAYQDCCEQYKAVFGKEFAPVLFKVATTN